jgi:hypothetical protein
LPLTWSLPSRRLGAVAASIAVLVALCVGASAARAAVSEPHCGFWNYDNTRLHVRSCADHLNTSTGPLFSSFAQADMRVQVPALVTACRIYMVESADDLSGHHVLQNTWRDCTAQARARTDVWTGGTDYFHDSWWTYLSDFPASCKTVQARIDLTYQGRVIRSGTANYTWGCSGSLT